MGITGDILYCGHCGNTGLMSYIANVSSFRNLPFSGEMGSTISTIVGDRETTNWVLYQCLVCGRPILISITDINGYINELEKTKYQFPAYESNYIGVPENIKSAFESAIKTKVIDHAICVLSLRRTLEMICKDKGAKGNSLESKINDLIGKEILPDMMSDACWIVRQSGNEAAHADDVEFTEYEVEEIVHYVAIAIEYLYSLPVRVATLKEKIEERKNNKK